ncbi:A24 family peptidase [Corynebacterium sp. L4756]|uniref:A24 family peptidase n=1 Tax=unclassified Corynebacterium TaxID=2624378 RepID=UPI00374CF4E6
MIYNFSGAGTLGAGALVLLLGLMWAALLMYFDITQRRLPDWLTIPAGIYALIYPAITAQMHGYWGLMWVLVYLALALFLGGVGGGDIKLAIPLGILIVLNRGLIWVFLAIVITAVITLAWGIAIRRRSAPATIRNECDLGAAQRDKFSDPPNGPGMLIATALILSTPC